MRLKDRVKKLETGRSGQGQCVVIPGRRQGESAQEYADRVARSKAEAPNGALVIQVLSFGFDNSDAAVGTLSQVEDAHA